MVLPEYLFLHFNRSEWDREACFRSWGSSTEVFSWDALCDMALELPPLSIQQKYVDIYNAMVANQQAYERGLEDLKLTCDGYIEDLRRKMPCEKIGKYIALTEQTNENSQYGIDDVMGISIEKKLIRTKADMKGVNLAPYLLIQWWENLYCVKRYWQNIYLFIVICGVQKQKYRRIAPTVFNAIPIKK